MAAAVAGLSAWQGTAWAVRLRVFDRDAAAKRERFLASAPIVARKEAGQGITHSISVTLSDGAMTHDAHIQTIDVYKPLYRAKDFVEKDFRDSYKYNIAAYRVAKMLDLDMVPVCAYRAVDGQPAAIDWWVDNVQFDEVHRRDKQIAPPDQEDWARQLNLVRVFDQLIDNVDRTQENLLIDKDWNVWMIDHSRSFRRTTVLRKPEVLRRVSRQMLDAMRALTIERCNAELQPYLVDEEIRTMLVRRDLLLKFFESAVAENGPDAVFFDIPRHTEYVTVP